MSAPRPIKCVWRDGVFVPDGQRVANYCEEQFGEGELVTLERHEERSAASHAHYFASIKTAWDNLPEADNRFPSPEALRKWALIKNGYCTESSIVADTPEQARIIAGFMGTQEGTIIVVRENIVKKFVAKSQSLKAMNKAEFQLSKTVVLDTIAELIAVSRKRLEQNAGASA